MSKVSDQCLMCHWYCDEVLEECVGQENPCHEFLISNNYKESDKIRMIEKYGENGKVRLTDIPNDELMKGADLESRMKAAREKERRLDEKVNSIFGL